MINLSDVKMLKKISKQLPDLIADFKVIQDKEYKEALQYVMKKYNCDLQKAIEIVKFTREHENIC